MIGKICVAAAAAWLALLGGASAAVDVTRPDQVIKSFNADDLVQISQAAGFGGQIVDPGNGYKVVLARMEQGSFFLVPKRCENGRCTALEIQALYNTKEIRTSDVNDFQVNQSVAMAYVSEGQLYVSRDEYADYGIPVGNLINSVKQFAAVAPMFPATIISLGGSLSQLPAPAEGERAFGEGLPMTAGGHADLRPLIKRYGVQLP